MPQVEIQDPSQLPNLGERFERFLAELDRREGYVEGHSVAVCDAAVKVARGLDVPESELVVLAVGALMHDIGKVFIDGGLLSKRGPLSEAESATIRLHPVLGEALLSPTISEPTVLEIVRWHHERWDGSGYPDGLDGPETPLCARIVATADAFIAMRETRAYRRALRLEEAVDELERLSGTQFDGTCVGALVESLD
jgi:HD-GYP domain-containing protein (c-di-GMP phosphodiesterase class II)